MKLSFLFFFGCCLHLSAETRAQEISLAVKDATMETVFKKIEAQSTYRFVFTREQLKETKPLTFSVKKEIIENVLERCAKEQPIFFTREENYVIVKMREIKAPPNLVKLRIDVTGTVRNEKGEAIEGATVASRDGSVNTTTDSKGWFVLKGIEAGSMLRISSIGYETIEIKTVPTPLVIILPVKINTLDETVVKGYYSTTRRFNTGNISKVSAEIIAQQPVSNPLASLQGRVPGLVVTQSSGVPGSSYKLQIRGQNSIAQGNEPFIIIDGVPFAPNNSNINQIGGAFSFNSNGLSAFSSINPDDIESIEILKDADATAIYGSRGANGVILITTKKGRVGEVRSYINFYSGIAKVTRTMDMLNTQQYVQMRKEAFANDGIAPTPTTASDILVWDTTRYTDWKKELIGGTANTTDIQAGLSGGSEQTRFLINGSYHHETTVYPGDMKDRRGAMHFSIDHHSKNKKFSIALSGNYSVENNEIINTDLTTYLYTIPNLPEVFDANGNLVFSKDGYNFNNPLSFLLRTYNARIDNLLSNLLLSYQIGHGFSIKSNLGFNAVNVNEINVNPIAAQNPAFNPSGNAEFGENHFTSVILEPQLEYQLNKKNGKLNVLLGGTWQQNKTNGKYILADGYTNDALLGSLAGAGTYNASSRNIVYKYAAAFIRAGYNWKNKYLINLTGRRDGSSRFGPGKRFANFGAVGAAWIFSNEHFLQNSKILTFGKLRASYGTTGNDAIGDYKYLSTYASSTVPYLGTPGVVPNGLYNPDYNWETNKKMEVAIELGLLKERIFLTAAWFRNRSSNHLVAFPLSGQTGFSSVTKNLPALVENTGWELELTSTVFKTAKFKWESSFSISLPTNTLLDYPELATSSYRNTYVVGQPLRLGNGFLVQGVDPNTGNYTFTNNKGQATSSPIYPDDLIKGLVKLDPQYYGGFSNTFKYNRINLTVFFEFRKQMGFSYMNDVRQAPGLNYNQPIAVLSRWQKPGDMTNTQRYTATLNNEAYKANSLINAYGASNLYTNASYIRLKNVALSYDFADKLIQKLRLATARVFLQGQNLATFTTYEGGDPESQTFYHLPPLCTIVLGFNVTF